MKKLILLCSLMLIAALALAGCGGGGVADEPPEEVLSETFTSDADSQIESGVVDVSLNVDAGDQGQFSLNLAGPFKSNLDDDDADPEFAFDGSLKGTVQGQSMEMTAGLTAAGGKQFLTVGEEAYELPEDATDDAAPVDLGSITDIPEDGDIREILVESCKESAEENGSDPAACDKIDSDLWLKLDNRGETDLNGEKTVLIDGVLDFDAMIDNLAAVSADVATDPMSLTEIEQAKGMVTESSFQVYTGADDTLLRRLTATATIDPSKVPSDSADSAPVDGPITLTLEVTLTEINEEQDIAVPANIKPIDELDPNSIGGGFLGALLGGFGGTDEGSSFGGSIDDVPSGDIPEVDLDDPQTQAYIECMEQADQTDVEALEECYSMLLE